MSLYKLVYVSLYINETVPQVSNELIIAPYVTRATGNVIYLVIVIGMLYYVYNFQQMRKCCSTETWWTNKGQGGSILFTMWLQIWEQEYDYH